jgi:NAD-dependent SIR2 family protein deacetylase
LKYFDDKGQLLRVYTQNIDSLEKKVGLEYGISAKRTQYNLHAHPMAQVDTLFTLTPRCIPLHGTLQKMLCQTCWLEYPISDFLDTLDQGVLSSCPNCLSLSTKFKWKGSLTPSIGTLRPSVLMYNEQNWIEEEVYNVIKGDLSILSKGNIRATRNQTSIAGADLLLVAGSSLTIPAIQEMVKKFSKTIKSSKTDKRNQKQRDILDHKSLTSISNVKTLGHIRTVLLNYNFPLPAEEWKGVFDIWVKGDVQEFSEILMATTPNAKKNKLTHNLNSKIDNPGPEGNVIRNI